MPYRTHPSVEARRVPRSHLHPRPAALILAILLAGCGTPHYLPLQILSPEPQEDSSARFGDLRVGLRAGYEWIEIRMQNEGTSPIEVSLGEATFSFEHGRPHHLVRSAFVDALRAVQWTSQSSFDSSWPRPVRWAYTPTAISEAGAHHFPRFLEHALVREPQVLKPGTQLEEVLYPGEHVHVEMDGSIVATSLLCARYGRSKVYNGVLEVRLPVRMEGSWRTLTVAARLGNPRP